MTRLLGAIHQVAAGETAGGRAAAAVGVVALLREEILNSNLGGLGHGEFSLAAVWAAEDVSQRHAGAALGIALLQNWREGRRLQVRLHGCKSWRVVLQRQVAQARQLIAGEGTQAGRVRRRGNGRVVRSGREGVMREGGRRGCGRVGRVGTRALDVTEATVVVVVAVVLTRVGSRHVVGTQAGRVAARMVATVAVVRVVTSRVAVASVLALDLVSGLGEHGDVAVAVVVSTRVGRGKRGKRVRRRDVGRVQGGGRRRTNGLGSRRRRHQALGVHVVRQTMVDGVLLVMLLLLLALVTTTRVGVVVDPRVPGQLVGARELLGAARELAGMRLLAGVSADMSGLVLEAVEGLVAERALVRARQLGGGGSFGGLGGRQRPVGLNDTDGGGSHVSVASIKAIAWVRAKRLLLLLK